MEKMADAKDGVFASLNNKNKKMGLMMVQTYLFVYFTKKYMSEKCWFV